MISERPITNPETIVNARILGGLPMLDRGEADDKIIAVLAERRDVVQRQATSTTCRRSWSIACVITSASTRR